MKIKIIIWALVLSASACQKEENGVIDIQPQFQSYVQKFIDEAAKYGQVIDFSDTGLSIQFRDAVDTETGGVCRGNYQIEIEKFYWDDLTDLQKEGLIFHELGHCELGRGHRNDTLPNGEWASRMRGDPVPEGLSVVINYSGVRRDYYINELFNEDTVVPEWSLLSAQFDQFGEDEKEVVLAIDET
ncbi:MAG: putative metallopeptidase, partial [Saprospiraceae bacterium]|nr:putative metallopeptidase [Saprospiraceae bacterium]